MINDLQIDDTNNTTEETLNSLSLQRQYTTIQDPWHYTANLVFGRVTFT